MNATPPAPPSHPAAPHHPVPSPTPDRTRPDARGSDAWLMFKTFLKKGKAIASFAPSSREMARSLVEGIDFDAAACIVELGAGTGPITAELVKRVKPHTKLIVVELDPDLCARLRVRFPHLDVIQGDACQLEKFLADRGIDRVDHICSELPLPSFPRELRDAIIATAAKVTAPGGTFRQLTVMPLVYWRLYRQYFEDVQFRFVFWNLPPGGVYICRRFRDKPLS